MGRALSVRSWSTVCVDDFNDFYSPDIKRANISVHLESDRYHLVEADIWDQKALADTFESHEIQKIVHLAARAGVRPSLAEPLLYEDVNVRATLYLLELARVHEVDQFLFASSSSVYGANKKVPFSEDDRIDRTISPYAATKYSGKLFCHTYHHLYGIPTTCLRFFTVYGPRQRPEMAIHKFSRLLFEGKPIPVYGNGESARDYTYIDDILTGLLSAIDRPLDFEVINLGESKTTTLRELVDTLGRLSSRPVETEHLPTQPGDVEITYADVSKARRLFDYHPTISIEDGLTKFLEWFERSLT